MEERKPVMEFQKWSIFSLIDLETGSSLTSSGFGAGRSGCSTGVFTFAGGASGARFVSSSCSDALLMTEMSKVALS